MGRSIHEIPRKETQDSRKTPVLEGSITQVQDLKLLLFHALKCIYEEHSSHIKITFRSVKRKMDLNVL